MNLRCYEKLRGKSITCAFECGTPRR
jgi:hypothetical protein